MIPLAGWFSERFGSKRVWLVSVALFAAGSALCGLATSAPMLIAFRVLQGLGGGMIMPVSMSVLAQTAGPDRIGRVMSVIGVPMLLGPILGPLLGSLIVTNTSWRWIFYVNVPLGIAALALGRRLLPRGIGRADAGRLCRPGALVDPAVVRAQNAGPDACETELESLIAQAPSLRLTVRDVALRPTSRPSSCPSRAAPTTRSTSSGAAGAGC